MNDTQWQTIANALRSLPAQDKWTSTTDETYRTMLAGLSHEDALRALVAYAATDGSTFRPTWSDLLRHAAGQSAVPAPSFADADRAWTLIDRAIAMIPGGTGDPTFPERHQAAIDWLRTQDEAVAAWAAQRGLRGRGSLGMEEVRGDYGGAVLHRLAGDYQHVRARAVERVQLGKPAFEPRAFLVRSTGDGGGGLAELVESLRPRRELPPGREAA